jgi:hypothetical protein
MNITVYKNYSKKTNSTARPSTGTTKDVKLKEPTDILNPVFIMGIDTEITEVYAFGMYYFKSNIVFLTNDLMELHCAVDPLATAKDIITAYTAFVERAASSYDNMIPDNALSNKPHIVNRGMTQINITEFNSTGCYIVRTVASDSDSSTGVNTYAVPQASMASLINYVFDDSNYSWFSDASNEFIKAVFNPFDYIIDVKWVPFAATTYANNTAIGPIKLGWWTTTANGYLVKQNEITVQYQVTRPTSYYNDFRQADSRYTQVELYIPCVGIVQIDPAEFTNGAPYLAYYIDTSSGEGMAYLRMVGGSTIKMLGQWKATTSAPIQLAQSSTDLKRIAGDIGSGVGNFFAGNYAGTASALVDVASVFASPDKDYVGSNGTKADIKAYTDIYCMVTSYETAQFPLAVAGRPLMQNVQLGTLSGFVKCGNASLDMPYPSGVREEVNRLLNSGFYLE